ncbi:MAG: hypothetical protein IB618_01090 [Candidatus Pacearchaeota archaeon]|nr:MAG: hypothetical protein IB618_01090 [Candidatus Pacearchaeota archaeon]
MGKRKKRRKDLERKKVMLPKSAYNLIIAEATEAWKKEIFGVIGGRGKNVYYVKEVFTSQTADKKYASVECFGYREARLKDSIERSGDIFIGDYHSHTDHHGSRKDWGLSDLDKEWLKEHPEYFSIVICLEEVCSLHDYLRMHDRAIIGPSTARDRESLNIVHKLRTALRGYYYDEKRKLFLKTDIVPTNGLGDLLIN